MRLQRQLEEEKNIKQQAKTQNRQKITLKWRLSERQTRD